MADLDADGNQDVVLVAPWQGSKVVVMYGNGAGGFASPGQALSAGSVNNNVIVGDYTEDGRPDLAVTGAFSFTVVINDGGRQFHTGQTYALGQSPFQNTGVAADLDGTTRSTWR